MAKDFPVDFRNDDLIGSQKTLENYRADYAAITDETSDFKVGYIESGIAFYEERIEQIKAQLEWFSFIDSETTVDYPDGEKWHNAQSLQASIDSLELTLKISPLCVGYIPTLNRLKWLAFIEVN